MNIKDLIKEKGYNVERLAKETDINPATMYRRLQTGDFKKSEILKIAKVLNMTGYDILVYFLKKQSRKRE